MNYSRFKPHNASRQFAERTRVLSFARSKSETVSIGTLRWRRFWTDRMGFVPLQRFKSYLREDYGWAHAPDGTSTIPVYQNKIDVQSLRFFFDMHDLARQFRAMPGRDRELVQTAKHHLNYYDFDGLERPITETLSGISSAMILPGWGNRFLAAVVFASGFARNCQYPPVSVRRCVTCDVFEVRDTFFVDSGDNAPTDRYRCRECRFKRVSACWECDRKHLVTPGEYAGSCEKCMARHSRSFNYHRVCRNPECKAKSFIPDYCSTECSDRHIEIKNRRKAFRFKRNRRIAMENRRQAKFTSEFAGASMALGAKL